VELIPRALYEPRLFRTPHSPIPWETSSPGTDLRASCSAISPAVGRAFLAPGSSSSEPSSLEAITVTGKAFRKPSRRSAPGPPVLNTPEMRKLGEAWDRRGQIGACGC